MYVWAWLLDITPDVILFDYWSHEQFLTILFPLFQGCSVAVVDVLHSVSVSS